MNEVTSAAVDISICLCTYNRADLLTNALNSLFVQLIEDAFTFEIVIVDDGSTDATPDVVRQAAAISPVHVRYIQQANSGIATARNRSVREATGAWIAFFDDDQIASPRWLLQLFQMAEKTGAECVGGPYLIMDTLDSEVQPVGTVRRLLGENRFMARRPSFLSRLDPRRKLVAVPGTGNALMKKDLFYRIGGFREGLRIGEDFEFFRKIAQTGIKMAIAPDAVIYHVIPASRLQPDYILSLAERGALSHADVDYNELSKMRLLLMVILRGVHLVGWTAPSLLVNYILNRQAEMLANRCSLRWYFTYSHRITERFFSKDIRDE